jgi:transcriptional regulator with GAF, ATPase, and Fis domain
MQGLLLNLSDAQRRFLSTLQLLGGTAHIDILDSLVPLSARELVDLLRKTSSSGLLQQDSSGMFTLDTSLPETVVRKIGGTQSRKALSSLVDTIYSRSIDRSLDPAMLLGILEKAGRRLEAALLELELSEKEMEHGKDHEKVRIYILNALERLTVLKLNPEISTRCISKALMLSNLSCVLGKGLGELGEILNTAHATSARLGDRRSHALISLHKGRLHYLTGRREEAFLALSAGLDEVNELGDEDILTQSAEFIGLFYFMKGQFREVMKHLDYCENRIGAGDEVSQPISFILFSYSAIHLGQFHRAIGFLDANLRLAESKGNIALSSLYRSILGTTLVLVKKYHEAEFHLKKARQDALDTKNIIGYHYSSGGLAYLYFMQGNLKQSLEIANDTIDKAAQAGLIQQFASPWIIEVLYEFDRLRLRGPSPYWNFQEILDMTLNGINIHLRGVALRLKACQAMDRGDKDRSFILPDLKASRTCLELSGNRIQMAKTVLEMAHLELLNDNEKTAAEYAQEAWILFGGYARDFFPDQYKSLLEKDQLAPNVQFTWGDYLSRYFEELNFIRSSADQEEALNKTIISTTRLFGAERGGLFWFTDGKYTRKPFLRAAGNLTKGEVESPQFKPCLEYVLKAFRTNRPMVVRHDPAGNANPAGGVRSILCLPIAVQGATRCVLYHDNAYMPDAFGYMDPIALTLLGKHTSDMVDFLLNAMKIRNEKEKLSKERAMIHQEFRQKRLIAKSRIMKELRSMVDQAAGTETTVLLLGETGTGKGVFARLVHENSRRSEGPFIVVDCTTIPENLVESELFGYEKGSFTGADRQKIGRMELAHDGTLFLDEIGELPLHLQAKLLRAIEEKSFVRIGGGKVIRSDFRLIAATNRNLNNEVAKGHFREDLYYRLNVFPISIPPLRDRGEDIVELARYFVEMYARQYERPGLKLSGKNSGMLMGYTWPGNVRELQNVLERAVILSKGEELEIPLSPTGSQTSSQGAFDDMPALDELQRRYIRHVLKHTKGKISGPGGAAEILGMKRTSLNARMKTLGMKK